jgi:hypothetical protein
MRFGTMLPVAPVLELVEVEGDALALAGALVTFAPALHAEQTLCADETPANVIRSAGSDGTVTPGSPQVITVRTPDEWLVWCAATPSRSAEAIKGL